MKKSCIVLLVALVILIVSPVQTFSYDLEDILQQLYLEDGVPGIQLSTVTDPGFTTLILGPAGTLVKLNSSIGTEASSVLLNSAVPSFGIIFDLETGLPERTTETFGPIYSERAQTIGRSKLKVGFSYTWLDFDEWEGDDIEGLAATTSTTSSLPDPFLDDTIEVDLSFDIDEHIFAFTSVYGVTDNFDIGVLVPYIILDYDVTANAIVRLGPDGAGGPPVHDFDGTADNSTSSVGKEVDGIGDIVLRGKYFVAEAEYADVAAALDIKFPTGDEDNFLGTGGYNFTPFIILSRSFNESRFNPHINIGYEFNEQDHDRNQVIYALGFDSMITDRVTAAVDFLGSNETDGDDIGDDIYDLSLGVKINPMRELILFANVQIPLNDEGLRSDFIPSAGIEYTF